MASTANAPVGAVPAANNDPFTSSPSHAHPAPLRYASFDNDQLRNSYSTNSPSQAKRALEAHLKDTDRRIQDASKLGTTLLQQRKNLSNRLKEVEDLQRESEVPPELRQKLTELEKEYNEVGRESARAFLPKSKAATAEAAPPSVFSSEARDSPGKVSAPSRRQRNQPSSRIHDIEFAAEISTQLLAQVRQLQAALAEKDDALQEVTSSKSHLEDNHANLALRMKTLDDGIQRHKDENWNLETKIQELETSLRESTDKEHRLNQTLKSTNVEKSGAQRDLDDLKVLHEKATDDHRSILRQHEGDLHILRRDASNHDSEKQGLQKKIEDLTNQNTELAKAVSYRWNNANAPRDVPASSDKDSDSFDDADLEPSEPVSPIKGTPARAGMLESETLKSSLNHAHRMIQNLKNNIHREKTEKVELRRMLNDARDELESRRQSGTGAQTANMSRKRRSEAESGKFKKPARPDRLGANRSSTTEILEDEPDWEDHDGPATPSKSRLGAAAFAGAAVGGAAAAGMAGMPGAFAGDDQESTDAFETADERRGETATETEAFQTGAESLGEDSDELTETEGPNRSTSNLRDSVATTVRPSARKHLSYISTASTSAGESDEDEQDVVRTPVQHQGSKYRLRVSRGFAGRKSSGRPSDSSFTETESPASSRGTPVPAGMSLGDELDGLDDDSIDGTPNSSRFSESVHDSPETQRNQSLEPQSLSTQIGAEDDVVPSIEDSIVHEPQISSPVSSPKLPEVEGKTRGLEHQANAAMLAHESIIRKVQMVDAGVMTEPWKPETEKISVDRDSSVQPSASEKEIVGDDDQHKSLRDRAGDLVGGALAGFGLGKLTSRNHDEEQEVVEPSKGVTDDGAVANEPKAIRDSILPAQFADTDTSEPKALRDSTPQPEPEVSNAVEAQKLQEAVPPFDPSARAPVSEPKVLSSMMPTLQASGYITPVATPKPAVAVFKQSGILVQETAPVEAVAPIEQKSMAIPFQQSGILAQETQPVASPMPLQAEEPKSREVPVAAAGGGVLGMLAGSMFGSRSVEPQRQTLGFSAISSQDYRPIEHESATETMSLPPRTSSRRVDEQSNVGELELEPKSRSIIDDEAIPGTDSARAGLGFFGTPPTLSRKRSGSVPTSQSRSKSPQQGWEPQVYSGGKGKNGIPTLVFGSDNEDEELRPRAAPATPTRAPLQKMPANVVPEHERALANQSMAPSTNPVLLKKPMADEGSQTTVSGDEIERMMRDKSKVVPTAAASPGLGALAGAGAGAAFASGSPRRSADSSAAYDPATLHTGPRRPASAGSMRNKAFAMPPPLPADHNQKIVAATQKGPSGAAPATPAPPGMMGPPIMPASAYRQSQRPKTPIGGEYGSAAIRTGSKDGTTPRPGRGMAPSPGGQVSHRTSVSSFASELDERFNIHRGRMVYPEDMPPTTDPRMIQAITQTMIGEYLWKYTRKAGRSEQSNTRHRRFFWVHPYTRTLYWSEKDPSTAGKDVMKAKSMPIEAVRVVSDDNAYPPGLHRKSIVVVTPGREIIFTAPTGQRHETWFNALSYLLLRTEQERHEADDTIDEEDLEEFNPGGPGFNIKRSISRLTGRSQSRQSLSSYNSRTTRTASPQKREAGSLAQRQAAAADRAQNHTPTPMLLPNPHASTASRSGRDSAAGGRFSSITSKFRSGGARGSFSSSRRGAQSALSNRSGRTDGDEVEGSAIYNASVVSDSAEDLRAVIERQERDADRVENVRACCDGKHDVGSLSRRGRHSSFGGRHHGHGHH